MTEPAILNPPGLAATTRMAARPSSCLQRNSAAPFDLSSWRSLYRFTRAVKELAVKGERFRANAGGESLLSGASSKPLAFASGVRVDFPSSKGEAHHVGCFEGMDDPVVWLLEDRRLPADGSRSDLNDPTRTNLEREGRIGRDPNFLPGAPLVAARTPGVALGRELQRLHAQRILTPGRGVKRVRGTSGGSKESTGFRRSSAATTISPLFASHGRNQQMTKRRARHILRKVVGFIYGWRMPTSGSPRDPRCPRPPAFAM